MRNNTDEGAAVGAWVLLEAGRLSGGCEGQDGADSKCAQRGAFSLGHLLYNSFETRKIEKVFGPRNQTHTIRSTTLS